MRHTAHILALAMLATLAGCNKKAPVIDRNQQSVINTLKEACPSIPEPELYKFAVVDSVSYGKEMDRNVEALAFKKRHMQGYASEYARKGMPRNAARWRRRVAHTDSVLVQTRALVKELDFKRNNTLYYVVTFTWGGRTENGTLKVFDDWYATIDKEYNVYNLQNDNFRITDGMGLAIPGFERLLDEINDM